MRILIAGGRGFLGDTLRRALGMAGHEVQVLTRGGAGRPGEIHWDGEPSGSWNVVLTHTDCVINACGFGLEHWPWTSGMKRRFLESRVSPGRSLAEAIERSAQRPRVFVQLSGINRYGLGGGGIADETTPPAQDFLAQLTVPWESATALIEDIGIRRIIVRNAIVLDAKRGLFPLMSLPCRLFLGGRLGSGRQIVPWIHIADFLRAVQSLLEDNEAQGAYNLVAPAVSTNAEFMRALCATLRRPYWFHFPGWLLRLALGEMSNLVLSGRASQPKRLLERGFVFNFPALDVALADLFGTQRRRQ